MKVATLSGWRLTSSSDLRDDHGDVGMCLNLLLIDCICKKCTFGALGGRKLQVFGKET